MTAPLGVAGRRVLRAPVLVLVALVVATAVWLRGDDGIDPAAQVADVATPADLAPLAVEEGPSTWFCAGGTAVPEGSADHVVIVSNLGASTLTGTLQVFPVRAEPLAPIPIEVGAGASASVRIGDLAVAEYTAAQVELDRGPAVVHQQVSGPGSSDVARCSTRASSTWYLPWGQTTLGSTLRLALFNPFPGDAVVDVTFDTEDGFRRPEAYQAMLVRARQLVVLDVEEVVTRRHRVSAQVVARSGRVVVDRVQTVAVGEETGVEVGGGAPAAAEAWYFPEGRADPSVVEAIYLFNPSEQAADVDVSLLVPNVDPATRPEPFQIRLAPGAASELVLNREPRVAQPLLHATAVSSDVPVVAERVLASGPFSAVVAPDLPPATAATFAPGLAASLGSPVLSTRWFTGPVPAVPPGASNTVSVLNTGSEDVTVRLTGADGAPVGEPATLGAGRTLEVVAAGVVVVEADGPVVVGQLWQVPEPAALATELGVAVRGDAEVAVPAPSFGGRAVAPATTPAGPPATTAPATAPDEPEPVEEAPTAPTG